MYGQRAVELVQEIKRTSADRLPPYPKEKISTVIREIEELRDQVVATLQDVQQRGLQVSDPSIACRLVVHHTAVERNKRCLLAYLMERLNRIMRLRWEFGRMVPDDVRESMSREEFDFFKKYSDNLGRYMAQFRHLDLATDVLPPKDLFIQCRVLQDAGTVMTSEGPLDLRVNCIVSVRREIAEPWIRKGVMQQM